MITKRVFASFPLEPHSYLLVYLLYNLLETGNSERVITKGFSVLGPEL